MRAATLILALIVALAAAGCGQTGPLYLPDDEQADNRDESTSE